MFSHVVVGSNDLERSKTFYDALFGAIGGKPAVVDPKGRLVYRHNGGMLMVVPPIDGQPARASLRSRAISYLMASPAEADAWHAAGVAAGGKSIEDPPGVRSNDFGSLYLAYLRDPDGNKLCATHRVQK